MNLLKRENWWIWLLITLTSGGSSVIVLGALLDCFDSNAWYTNWKNWLLGFLCFIFPFTIMIAVFNIELLVQSAAKLEVPGKEIYLSPYIWILCLIIPIIGWIMFIVMMLYLEIWVIVSLYKGNAEQYI